MVAWDKLDSTDSGYDWAIEANIRMNKYMLEGDFHSLINYESLGREFRLSIPSPDHFLPLLYVLGLKEKNENIKLFNDKCVGGTFHDFHKNWLVGYWFGLLKGKIDHSLF